MTLATPDVMQHWGTMLRVCAPLLDAREDAEDCAAQVVLQVLARSDPDVRNLEALMVKMVKRRATDMLRARTRQRARDARLAQVTATSVGDAAEAVLDNAEATWLHEAARAQLSPLRYRLLTLLAEGHHLRDVARELGITHGVAQSQLYQLRRILRTVHGKTLAVLAAVWSATRRVGVTAAPATGLAAAVLVLIPAVAGVVREPTPDSHAVTKAPSLQTAVGRRDAHTERQRRPMTTAFAPRTQTGPATGLKSHAVGPAVVALDSPAGSTRVERRESGGDEEGPIEVLTACLEQFTVSATHVGC